MEARRQGPVLSTAQQPQGGISAEAFAKECKGAFSPVRADSRQLKSYFGNDRLPVRYAVVRMEPSEGSVAKRPLWSLTLKKRTFCSGH